MLKAYVLVLFALIAIALAEVYFYEPFNDNWEKNWVVSKARSDYGAWKHTAGDWYGDKDADRGIQTSQDARFYAISSKFQKKMPTNKDKTLVIQYSVKFPQGIDCGGGYIKVLPEDGLPDQTKFDGDSKYAIMFGPDVCGSATRRVHFIFQYKGKNLLWKKTLPCETDKLTHLYTAIVRPDNTYEVHIDGEKKESGKLEEDWDFLPPKQIPDPNAKKPADWVDEKEIADPTDKKPEDWDKEPKTIADPEAKKPADWNDEEDGKWEPPTIPNPKYKGEWKPKMIPNPAYKGPWSAPLIDNPEYKPDSELYRYDNLNFVGVDLWQVKSGTILDDILVTDDIDTAKKFAEKTLTNKKKEKEMFDKIEEENRKKEEEERKKAEEARQKEEEAKKKAEGAEADSKKTSDEEAELKKAAEEKARAVEQESAKDKKEHDEL
jgi:calreticulin